MSGSGENTPASFLNEVSLNHFSHDIRFDSLRVHHSLCSNKTTQADKISHAGMGVQLCHTAIGVRFRILC